MKDQNLKLKLIEINAVAYARTDAKVITVIADFYEEERLENAAREFIEVLRMAAHDFARDEVEAMTDEQFSNCIDRQNAKDGQEILAGLTTFLESATQEGAGSYTGECHECEKRFRIEGNGVAHHIDQNGGIDHDLDALHVPFDMHAQTWKNQNG